MTELMNLISALDQSTQQYSGFISNLLSTRSDLPFDADEVKVLLNSIISIVNSRLNQTITRYDGLYILLNILPRCSKDLLSKYGSLWISKAVQVLESNKNDIKEITLSCKVLATLATLCKEIPELQKQISMQTSKQLVTLISNMEQNQRCGAIFFLLATLMYHYKESCEKLQAPLRKLILPTIDSKQKNLVQAGANCFALLAKATERTFKPPSIKPMYTSCIYNQSLICNSLHVIMDDLFSDIMEMETADIWVKLELPRISETNLFDYYFRLDRRFENLSIFLSTMLRGCAGRNSVCPSDILKVICRGLAVTPAILKTNTFKHQMLSFILPKMHINLLMMLNALIYGFRQELVPHGKTILKLYVQTLSWSENVNKNLITISGSKPFKSVRNAIYKSLSLWLTHLSTLSAIEIAADEIIPYLLKEITPERTRVLLTVEKTHNLSKKALKRFKESQYENSTVLGSSTAPVEKDISPNEDLCEQALIALELVLYNFTSLIKLPLYKNTQNLIVSLLYDVYLAIDETNFYKKNHNCRHQLLKVLRAIQMNSHPLMTPPTHYSIEIFNLALNDEYIKIVNEAKLSLVEIEKIVHPCAASLQFPSLNNRHEEIDIQLPSTSLVDVIVDKTMNEKNMPQQNVDINDKNECDLSNHNSSKSTDHIHQTQSNGCEKHKNDESIENIINENCDGPKPTKQRKLQPNDTFDSSIQHEISDNEADEMIEKHTTTNSQNNQSIIELEIDETASNHKFNRDELSIKNINENTFTQNVDKEQIEIESKNDSEDEVIMGLFCDELK